jgi:hypothetical protein
MVSVSSSLLQYLTVSKDLAQSEANFSKSSPTFQNDVAHFRAALPNIKSVDDLLSDRTTLKVALGAFGLDSQVDAKGLIRAILTQDPNASSSYVNRLIDPRYKQFVTAFSSLATDGGAGVNAAGFADAIVNAYEVDQFETAQGAQDPAVREALYFARTAGKVTSTLQILGDRTLADVVRTAQGLPAAFSALDPTQQVGMLTRAGFDPTKLQDPAFVQKYVARYLTLYDIANPPNGDPTGGLAALFAPPGDPTDPTSFITPVNLSSLAAPVDSSNPNAALLSLFA